jgi:hypothetical protein
MTISENSFETSMPKLWYPITFLITSRRFLGVALDLAITQQSLELADLAFFIIEGRL